MLNNTTQQNLINDAKLRFQVTVFLSKAKDSIAKSRKKNLISIRIW